MSPFRNGVLRRHDGSMRLRSSSERAEKRVPNEQSQVSYPPIGGVPFASSPTLNEYYNGVEQKSYTDSAREDDDLIESRNTTYNTPAILEEDENDPYSHAAMTRRAEEILANAKKRLTNMEGNLSRARSTLERRPSSSMSSFENRSTEPVSLYTIPGKSRTAGGYSPAKHRQANLPTLIDTKQGHSRVFSETSVPSTLQTGLPNGQSSGEDIEALNGLGISGMDVSTRERNSEPSRNWFWNGLTRNTSLNHGGRHNHSLQPLKEDGPAPDSFKRPEKRQEVIEEEETVDLSSPTAATFNVQHPPTAGLSRARSTTQMSDLREQMSDLKGKISSLKQRAREDNLRRRSLQSLRTPSPFTAAPEQWYAGSSVPADTHAKVEPNVVGIAQASSGEEERGRKAFQDSGHASPVLDPGDVNTYAGKDAEAAVMLSPDPEDLALTDSPHPEDEIVPTYPSKKGRLVLGSPEPEVSRKRERLVILSDSSPTKDKFNQVSAREPAEEPPPADAREDSMYGDEDLHVSPTSPIVERHEDRPDAFDYEHFILHSAMGSYSGVGMRRSSSTRKRGSSESSASSVETAKARNSTGEGSKVTKVEAAVGVNGSHGRQNSMDSVSTSDTFATADEGQDGKVRSPRHILDHPKKHKGSPEMISPSSPNKSRVKHISTAQKVVISGKIPKPAVVEKAPVDLLSYLASVAPREETESWSSLQLGDRDKELVERLVKSLAKVCGHVQGVEAEGSKYEGRVFRRKLDAARRVLDGEMNGEAF
ncbi:hypothetical protein P7C71_g5718, partial [Lecanoromycetidae sp. Uapishka_2]